jgi:tripartite-type tricarboxylate transporter receptor subunit TctC
MPRKAIVQDGSQHSLSEEITVSAHREWLRVGLLCLLATTAHAGSPAQAQTYPAGPVKFITQLGPGSGTDPAMRIVIDQLGKMWGQQTLLINQPGAGGALAARAAHSAAPDGHTLYMAIASTFTVLPQLQPDLPFNVNDFVPIGFVGEVPMAIAVVPALAVNSLPELIAYSKKQAGGLNVAITRGGIPHMATHLLRNRSGVDLTYVFYPGSSQAIGDVISGRVPVIVDGLAGPITGGQLKLLAIASPDRVASRPDIPTVAETVPGFVATGWFVLVAPPSTSAAIVRKVSEDLNAVLARPEVRQKLDALSISTRAISSEGLSKFIKSERELWKPVIQQLGLATQ